MNVFPKGDTISEVLKENIRMNTCQYLLTLPSELRIRIEDCAKIHGISIESFIQDAIAERVTKLAIKGPISKLN
jgi:hypothetical protein